MLRAICGAFPDDILVPVHDGFISRSRLDVREIKRLILTTKRCCVLDSACSRSASNSVEEMVAMARPVRVAKARVSTRAILVRSKTETRRSPNS